MRRSSLVFYFSDTLYLESKRGEISPEKNLPEASALLLTYTICKFPVNIEKQLSSFYLTGMY